MLESMLQMENAKTCYWDNKMYCSLACEPDNDIITDVEKANAFRYLDIQFYMYILFLN